MASGHGNRMSDGATQIPLTNEITQMLLPSGGGKNGHPMVLATSRRFTEAGSVLVPTL
jgi:hypothetical protein